MNASPEANDTPLAAALRYAELGYPVFPVWPGRKNPMTSHGCNDATADPDRIRAWWGRWPDANVGVSAAGVVVVDLDAADHPWLLEPGWWPDSAPVSRTPRGGWHIYLARPADKPWACSEGALAGAVDIRTDGGYAVESPSATDQGRYEWVKPLRRPEELPAAPEWLAAVLDSYHTPEEVGPAASAHAGAGGGRPGDDFNCRGSWAETGIFTSGWTWQRRTGDDEGHLTRPGKSGGTSATVGLCKSRRNGWPLLYCFSGNGPPIPAREPLSRFAVFALLQHAGDYAAAARDLRDRGYGEARPGPGGGPEPAPAPIHAPLSARELIVAHPRLRPPVVHGLLRAGETMNVIAAPKTGKSWLTIDLALCVAAGVPWLGHGVEAGRVLILDNELHGETSADRLPKVAGARGIPLADYADGVFVENLRGRLRDLPSMTDYFAAIPAGRYRIIVLDAWYRFLPAGVDENDNGAMAGLYNLLDWHAARLGCAFVPIHHSSKGSQSGKSVTDIGAGAGSQSRAADCHLVLRPHAEPGVVVLEAAARSWPPPTPACLRFEFPVWTPVPDLDPRHLHGTKPAGDAGEEGPAWCDESVADLVREGPLGIETLVARIARASGLSATKARQSFKRAAESGVVVKLQKGRNEAARYCHPDSDEARAGNVPGPEAGAGPADPAEPAPERRPDSL